MKKFLFKRKKYLIIYGIVILFVVAGVFYWGKLTKKNTLAVATTITNSQDFSLTLIPVDPKIQEFGLKIDKLGILVPVVKDVDGGNKAAYIKALKKGVAHFATTALPGEKGNIFIFGHSSDEIKSDYSTIFAKLNHLEKGDEITILYQTNEHKYKVKEKKIIKASDLSVLEKGEKEMLTLMTCWPIGTIDKRLIIKAEPE